MICFEVQVNENKPIIAGDKDLAVLSVISTYAKKYGKLDLDVGGFIKKEGEEDQYPKWLQCSLAPGDLIVIRVLDSNSADPPSTVHSGSSSNARAGFRLHSAPWTRIRYCLARSSIQTPAQTASPASVPRARSRGRHHSHLIRRRLSTILVPSVGRR